MFNIKMTSSGYIYYITAVDSRGNESFFSRAIDETKYSNIIPSKIDNKSLVSNGKGYLEEFPETVKVMQKDNETFKNYPINFYKIENSESTITKKCDYKYEVVGTKLTGRISYYNENCEFPAEVKSRVQPNKGGFVETPVQSIPSVDTDGMSSEYNNAKIDLASKTTYPEGAKVKLDSANLLRRADMEVARLFTGGIYSKSLDTIDSYVADDNPEYIAIKHPNGVIEVVKNDGSVTKQNDNSTTKPADNDVIKPNNDDNNTTIPNDNDNNVTTPNNNDNNNKEEEADTEINNNNYVDEQRKSTEKEVEEGNKQTVKDTEYPIFVKTAGQKYLALCLINHEDEISLKAFPEYRNPEEFFDDLTYVWYQNPYIMTLDLTDENHNYFSSDYSVFYPKYGVDKTTTQRYQEAVYKKSKEVVNSIITNNMDEEEKIAKIYKYLEDNAKYNDAALEYAEAGNQDVYQKYPNSWNTYGILCEGLGVCQSYAYAFNILAYESGLESVMATGMMNNGGHAWNAVKIDGVWYMVDTTNNGGTFGVPYWVCCSSTDFIYENTFVLDEAFVDGTDYYEYLKNDDKCDWYTSQGLFAKSVEDCVDIWIKEKDKNNEIFIKYSVNDENSFISSFIQTAQAKGVDIQKDLATWNYATGAGMIMFVNSK